MSKPSTGLTSGCPSRNWIPSSSRSDRGNTSGAFSPSSEIDTSLPTLYGNADLFASYPGTEATLELAAYANNILAFNLPHNACFHSVLHPSERQAHSVGDRVNFPPVGAQTSGLIPEYILHSSPEDNRPYFNPNLTNTTMSHHDPMVSSSQGRWQHAIPNYYQCDLENPSRPLYHAFDDIRGYEGSGASAAPSRARASADTHPCAAITTRDFIHMNDTFLSTDLPEAAPFALDPTGANASFSAHPHPNGHQWPQTFKITEVKQIGPKKQTLACFFCRSRKIACGHPPDRVEDRTCDQCEKRGIDCKYPTESRRGQHNRTRS